MYKKLPPSPKGELIHNYSKFFSGPGKMNPKICPPNKRSEFSKFKVDIPL
jgi:hypothetical protein